MKTKLGDIYHILGLKHILTFKFVIFNPQHPLVRMSEVPPEGLIADLYAAITVIPTATITETNEADIQYSNSDNGDAWET